VSDALELLALRKEVLVARASLQRLKAGIEIDALRESTRWPRVASSIAASPQGRSMLLGLLLAAAGPTRAGRLIRWAGGVVLVARVVSLLAGKDR
jgi:hypothetical protein